MRTQQQLLADYAASHRHPTNQVIHLICVPVIFFATSGLLWFIPLGRWLTLSTEFAGWVNGFTVIAVLVTLFYLRLSAASALAMLAWFGASVAGIVIIQRLGWPLFWICVALWAIGWTVQFVGHKIERAKPSFTDDIVFLLVGPLFVMRELRERLRSSGSVPPRKANGRD